ncbi:MAG TPA: SMP-30/gluconolactonase/LRE family protein [Prolixibacteraceae bacterium]|nr:SMP-30/gluconolactonase/LRE family protein [Prolixibacteraceae bacterium]
MKNVIILLLFLSFVGCKSEPRKEYILADPELVPEGIAFSRRTNSFYLTSLAKAKIVKVNRTTGEQEDFIGELEFEYQPGVGIYVDDERNRLYALGGYYLLKDSIAALYAFDLTTQELVKRVDMPHTGEHFLNDLIMDKDGNLYMTDTKDSSVYRLNLGSDSLELFFKSPEIKYPNGIAISDDNTKLYIASFPDGVRILDLKEMKILNQVDTAGLSNGIDGLEFYQGNLYAVQNGVRANSNNFRKLILNKDQDQIMGVEVIDSNNPELELPLTFCMADHQAIVIANSNLQYWNQTSLQFDLEPDSLKNTKLLVYNLK